MRAQSLNHAPPRLNFGGQDLGKKAWGYNIGVGVCDLIMGIQGLMKLIGDYAPLAVKENDIKSYFGRQSVLF